MIYKKNFWMKFKIPENIFSGIDFLFESISMVNGAGNFCQRTASLHGLTDGNGCHYKRWSGDQRFT